MSNKSKFSESLRMLDTRLLEISKRDIKPKNVVRREILCDILKLPKNKDAKSTDNLIREALTPICIKYDVTYTHAERNLLFKYFNIPVYRVIVKNILTKYKIIEVLANNETKFMSAKEISEYVNLDPYYITGVLRGCYRQDWVEKTNIKEQCQRIRWKITEAGIQAYQSGKAQFLQNNEKHRKVTRNKTKRIYSAPTSKILSVLAISPYPLTDHALVIATGMSLKRVRAILFTHYHSKNPFFKRTKIDGEINKFRWHVTNEGYNYYYQWNVKT